jgi:hypothetical protein
MNSTALTVLDEPVNDSAVGEERAAHRIPLADGWSLWRHAAVRGAGMPVSWLERFAAPGAGTDDARAVSAAAVRAVVAEPPFLEAVTWQNPTVVRNWLGHYAAESANDRRPHLARRDQREALVAFLAQRYCAKNETIGFFGPVAWARFVDSDAGLVTHGGGGLRRRSLFVEAWAVAAIAQAMAADPALSEHLIARRNPVCDLSDGLLRQPRRAPIAVTGAARALLEELARPRRVAEVIDACLPGDPTPGDRATVTEALERMRAAGTILVGLPIPVEEHPEQRLRRHLACIPDPVLRRALGTGMDRLDQAVDGVRHAAGDPQSLLAALDRLEGEFGSLVGRVDRRTKSRPVGRGLVYEDCRRDLDVTIGADLLDELRAPLAIVLDTARWFLAETGAELERDLKARYQSLSSRSGAAVPLCDLVLASGDVLNGMPGTAVERVGADLLARWAELLSTASGTPAAMSSTTLRPLVRTLFPAGTVAWRAARQHSPDLLLRMTTTPHGRRHQWVLGELHLALNTLENRPFLTQADDRADLFDATAADFPDGRFVPVYPRDAPEVTSRTYPPLAMDLPDRYRYWSYTVDDGHPLIDAPLPGAGLLVCEDQGRLVVRPASGRWKAALLEVLGEFLTALVVNRFRVRTPAAHQPRLLLDNVVIARETWHVSVAEVPLPPAEGAEYRHAGLRAWLIDRATPRFLFVKTLDQRKPYLLDRDAPLSLRNFARGLRRTRLGDPAATVTLVEMLPAPDELWLTDADGQRYTSELRVVAFDRRQPDGGLVVEGPALADETGGAV